MDNGHEGLPLGFKFKPTNSELIWFLLHKVNGLAHPSDYFIIDCDLYDENDSWKQIFDGSQATHLYFFTKLKKISEKGTLIGGNHNRRTGSGTWKGTQNCGTIYDPHSNPRKPIGSKRSFRFVPNKDVASEFTGRWLMDEFSLDSRFVRQNMDEYVVCCIKHEEDRRSKLRCPNSVQPEQENCRNSSNPDSFNDTTVTTTLDSENGATNIGDPNLCFTQDDLPALFDPNLCFNPDEFFADIDLPNLSTDMMEENGSGPDCVFSTTSDGSGFTGSNSATNTSSLLMMDAPFVPNQSFSRIASNFTAVS